MNFLDYNWQTSECLVSIRSESGPNEFAYIKEEFEYIDFIIDLVSLGETLQINGHLIGRFEKRKYGEELDDLIAEFIPSSKSTDVTLYYQPIGANTYALSSVVCDITSEGNSISWSNFGRPNPAWTEPIENIPTFSFDKEQYVKKFQKLKYDLQNFKTEEELDALWRKKYKLPKDDLPF